MKLTGLRLPGTAGRDAASAQLFFGDMEENVKPQLGREQMKLLRMTF